MRTISTVILVAREGQRLHFDLSHHKCLFYKTIGRLSESLEKTVLEMFGIAAPDYMDGKALKVGDDTNCKPQAAPVVLTQSV